MAQPIFSLASDSYSSELEITAMSGTESISSFFELKITFKIKNDIAKSLDHSLLTQEQITLTIDDTILPPRLHMWHNLIGEKLAVGVAEHLLFLGEFSLQHTVPPGTAEFSGKQYGEGPKLQQ